MVREGMRFWIGVASKDHVVNGVRLGICQFCHGKQSPVQRLSKGDYIVYYSSKVTMEGSEPYQKYTAIGVVSDEVPYQVEMENGFKPYRRKVEYLEAQHTDIKPLIPRLPFIKNKSSWGYMFRYGFFEIDQESFEIIAEGMLGKSPL
jgi:predicted RNA-binding protein